MQLVEMLNGKELSMKREVFAKNAHSIGGVLIVKEESENDGFGSKRENKRMEETKNPCSFLDVAKSEHGYILCRLITLINQVLIVGFSPKIVVIPTL